MPVLISLEMAKDHLGIAHANDDADIYAKAEQASDIVAAHLNTATVWTAATAPKPIQSAVLLVLAHLYEHRGDVVEMGTPINEAVERVLVPWRTGALA